MKGGGTHYCEIVSRDADDKPVFNRGQASSYRVAAERAIAGLCASGPGFWENVRIRTGRVK